MTHSNSTKLIIYLILILSIYGCKKNDTRKEFTLQGQLQNNCTGSPLSNVTLELWQNLQKGTSAFDPDDPAYLIMSTKTDINGNFEFKKEFDTNNSSNFPRDGSIRIPSFTLATGWLEIESGKHELDIGKLYKDIDKTLPFVLLNHVSYEVGDKIILSKHNDHFSYDTILVTDTSNRFIVNRQAHFSTKNIVYGTTIDQCTFSGIVSVKWDFINKPDKSGLFSINTNNCPSQDTIYLKWW